MKYLLITLSSASIILLFSYIICQQEIKTYEAMIDEEDSLFVNFVSLDSLDRLAYSISEKNKLRHQHDLQQIDSLNLVCVANKLLHEDDKSSSFYAAEVMTTIIKDTIVYRNKYKDSIIYKFNHTYINDTIYKTIEIVDTIYKTFRKKRKK